MPGLVQQRRGEVVALATRRLARNDVVVVMKWGGLVHAWCAKHLGMGRGVLQGAAARLGGRLGSRGERATAKGRVEVEAVIPVERDVAAKCLDVTNGGPVRPVLLKAVGSPQGGELACFGTPKHLITGIPHAKLQRA